MKIKVKYLNSLLDELVAKHHETREPLALKKIGEDIGISSDYLYKKIAQPISKLRKTDTIGLRDSVLIKVVNHLGFENIKMFRQFVDNPVSQQVKSLAGTYYTYVRRNTQEGVLLRSPVRVYEKDHRIFMVLKGERLNYSGEIKMMKGVLTILLENDEGKCFHHVYKIGSIEKPKLLQGIFSGVTSGFDPIGGRVVLERREEEFSTLKTAALDVTVFKKSQSKNDRLLAKYFAKYSENNLKIGRTTTFGFNDLE